MYLWANGYAALNRVNRSFLEENQLCQRAEDIDISQFLPSVDDLELVRERMEILVSRVVCHHIPHFKLHYSDVVTRHIPHQYSHEMSKKSKIVSFNVTSIQSYLCRHLGIYFRFIAIG